MLWRRVGAEESPSPSRYPRSPDTCAGAAPFWHSGVAAVDTLPSWLRPCEAPVGWSRPAAAWKLPSWLASSRFAAAASACRPGHAPALCNPRARPHCVGPRRDHLVPPARRRTWRSAAPELARAADDAWWVRAHGAQLGRRRRRRPRARIARSSVHVRTPNESARGIYFGPGLPWTWVSFSKYSR